jgi:hypothetical protein
MKSIFRAAAFAATLMLIPAAHAETAVLRALDKVTGTTKDLSVPVGQPVKFGTLTITARTCGKKPAEETPEVYAYLQINDKPVVSANEKPIEDKQVFAGWMFWSSPGLNPLENPVYDVWVIDCKT